VKYCLDANVFIEAHRRYYSFDIAPPFWEALANWGAEQMICGISLVHDDLVKNDDELSRWAKTDGASIFLDPDTDTYRYIGEIGDLVTNQYKTHQVNAFMDCSDPWVIAYAKAHHLVVVTMEVLRQEQPDRIDGKIAGKKIQIPNVCQKVGVEFMDTFRLLRDLKFTFR
jgi:hypothetical protein